MPPRYPYRSLQELDEMSPSRRDGVSPDLERRMIRTAVNLIIASGARLNMDMVAVSTALIFLHRFYSQASLLRNERFVVSTACLYLAGKVEDCPKSLRDVLWVCYAHRYRAHPAAQKHFTDREFQEAARERVFAAERALLYGLGFDFDVGSPPVTLVQLFKEEPLRALHTTLHRTNAPLAHYLITCAYNMCNDSLKTRLCLQFSALQVAGACTWMSLKLLRLNTRLLDARGQLWWEGLGLRPHHLDEISRQLVEELYDPEAARCVLGGSGSALGGPACNAAIGGTPGGGCSTATLAVASAAAAAGQEQQQDSGAEKMVLESARHNLTPTELAGVHAAAKAATAAAQAASHQAAKQAQQAAKQTNGGAAAAGSESVEDLDAMLDELGA